MVEDTSLTGQDISILSAYMSVIMVEFQEKQEERLS